MNKSSLHRAFTLIELLVVMAIIGILAGFLVPAMQGAALTGRQTNAMNNARQIGLALRMYAGDNDGQYPATTVPVGSTPGTPLAQGSYSNDAFNNLMPKYTTSKKIFINKNSAYCKTATADTAGDLNTIKVGQNDWLYMLGLSDTSDARYPLIATATKSASDLTYTNVTSAKGGVWAGTDAVVAFCDGSAKPMSTKDMNLTTPTATFINSPDPAGGNIFTGTETWMGTTVYPLAPE